jgi:hypothetical protein
MELLPKELGVRRHVAVTLLRSSALHGQMAPHMTAPQVISQAEVFRSAYSEVGRMARDVSAKVSTNPNEKVTAGPLTRFYMSMMDMPPNAARQIISTQGGMIGGMAGGFGGGFGFGFMFPAFLMFFMKKKPEIAIIFFLIGLIGLAIGILGPAFILRNWSRKALTTLEVTVLAEAAKEDALEQEFLHLVQDALLYVPSSAQAEKELKDAIRSLGDAIDRLPPAHSVSVNVAELQADLERVREEAETEQDTVIRESLNRRATAIRQSLQGAKRTERNNRRAEALREELLAQVRALRISLSDRYERSEDVIRLDGLADSMGRINTEADAIADAQLELEEALAEPRAAIQAAAWNATEEEKPQIVRVSRQ